MVHAYVNIEALVQDGLNWIAHLSEAPDKESTAEWVKLYTWICFPNANLEIHWFFVNRKRCEHEAFNKLLERGSHSLRNPLVQRPATKRSSSLEKSKMSNITWHHHNESLRWPITCSVNVTWSFHFKSSGIVNGYVIINPATRQPTPVLADVLLVAVLRTKGMGFFKTRYPLSCSSLH